MSHYTTMYPCREDFIQKSEHFDPHIFNYFCISGDQLWLTNNKRTKQFEVVSSGWKPLDYNADKFEKYHTLYSSRHFDDAKSMFVKYCSTMITFNPSLFGHLK